MPVRVIASSLALIGFIVAALTGALAGNPTVTTLSRALTAMAVCYLAGLAVGHLGRAAVHEHVERHKQAHPIPDIEAETGQSPTPETPGDAQPTRHADADARSDAVAGAAQG